MNLQCDIAVLGGGPAGAATALLLRKRAGLSVTLLERSGYEAPRIGETVSPASRRIFEELGIWEAFQRDGHLPSQGTCSCWGSSTPGYNDYLYSPLGPGWHLDRQRFDRMLAEQARAHGVEVLTSTEPSRWEPRAQGGYTLHLDTGEGPRTLEARFVVDATGRRSAFASSQGARRLVADRVLSFYGFFSVRPGSSFDTYALVETCREGWWYSALLPGGRVAVGLMGTGDSLRGLKRDEPEAWLALLKETGLTRQRLESCTFSGEPLVALPAQVSLLDRVQAEDWIAVGDAACTYDPLSSQGILKALGSASQAAEALARAARGDRAGLRAYGGRVRELFREHLAIRGGFYRQETRWPEAPFWKSHREPVVTDELGRS
ncbi:tryptophan 7-halogenase [Hyalangium versicolor]|uniref:tryptophan 7-halogenase n=1 Tax=Hyalangium versicolor TaxID=2861190 RepID=UPI001CCCE2FA|nr:tryptophan 7-halogenase [Hyalangium versicolor]